MKMTSYTAIVIVLSLSSAAIYVTSAAATLLRTLPSTRPSFSGKLSLLRRYRSLPSAARFQFLLPCLDLLFLSTSLVVLRKTLFGKDGEADNDKSASFTTLTHRDRPACFFVVLLLILRPALISALGISNYICITKDKVSINEEKWLMISASVFSLAVSAILTAVIGAFGTTATSASVFVVQVAMMMTATASFLLIWKAVLRSKSLCEPATFSDATRGLRTRDSLQQSPILPDGQGTVHPNRSSKDTFGNPKTQQKDSSHVSQSPDHASNAAGVAGATVHVDMQDFAPFHRFSQTEFVCTMPTRPSSQSNDQIEPSSLGFSSAIASSANPYDARTFASYLGTGTDTLTSKSALGDSNGVNTASTASIARQYGGLSSGRSRTEHPGCNGRPPPTVQQHRPAQLQQLSGNQVEQNLHRSMPSSCRGSSSVQGAVSSASSMSSRIARSGLTTTFSSVSQRPTLPRYEVQREGEACQRTATNTNVALTRQERLVAGSRLFCCIVLTWSQLPFTAATTLAAINSTSQLNALVFFVGSCFPSLVLVVQHLGIRICVWKPTSRRQHTSSPPTSLDDTVGVVIQGQSSMRLRLSSTLTTSTTTSSMVEIVRSTTCSRFRSSHHHLRSRSYTFGATERNGYDLLPTTRLQKSAPHSRSSSSGRSISSVRSIPYLSQHWSAGKTSGDRVLAPRNSFVRGLNLVFDPRPRLEVLPSPQDSRDSLRHSEERTSARASTTSTATIQESRNCPVSQVSAFSENRHFAFRGSPEKSAHVHEGAIEEVASKGMPNSAVERSEESRATKGTEERFEEGSTVSGRNVVILGGSMDDTPGSPRNLCEKSVDSEHAELASPTKACRPPIIEGCPSDQSFGESIESLAGSDVGLHAHEDRAEEERDIKETSTQSPQSLSKLFHEVMDMVTVRSPKQAMGAAIMTLSPRSKQHQLLERSNGGKYSCLPDEILDQSSKSPCSQSKSPSSTTHFSDNQTVIIQDTTISHDVGIVALSRENSDASTSSVQSSRKSSRLRRHLRTNSGGSASSSPRTGSGKFGLRRSVKKVRSRTFASAFGIDLSMIRRDTRQDTVKVPNRLNVDDSPFNSTNSSCPSTTSDLDLLAGSPLTTRASSMMGAGGCTSRHKRDVSRSDSILDLLDEDRMEELLAAEEGEVGMNDPPQDAEKEDKNMRIEGPISVSEDIITSWESALESQTWISRLSGGSLASILVTGLTAMGIPEESHPPFEAVLNRDTLVDLTTYLDSPTQGSLSHPYEDEKTRIWDPPGLSQDQFQRTEEAAKEEQEDRRRMLTPIFEEDEGDEQEMQHDLETQDEIGMETSNLAQYCSGQASMKSGSLKSGALEREQVHHEEEAATRTGNFEAGVSWKEDVHQEPSPANESCGTTTSSDNTSTLNPTESREHLLIQREGQRLEFQRKMWEYRTSFPDKTLSAVSEHTELPTISLNSALACDGDVGGGEDSQTQPRVLLQQHQDEEEVQKDEDSRSRRATLDSTDSMVNEKGPELSTLTSEEDHTIDQQNKAVDSSPPMFITMRSRARTRAVSGRHRSVARIEGASEGDKERPEDFGDTEGIPCKPSPGSRSLRLNELGLNQGIWTQSPIKLPLTRDGSMLNTSEEDGRVSEEYFLVHRPTQVPIREELAVATADVDGSIEGSGACEGEESQRSLPSRSFNASALPASVRGSVLQPLHSTPPKKTASGASRNKSLSRDPSLRRRISLKLGLDLDLELSGRTGSFSQRDVAGSSDRSPSQSLKKTCSSWTARKRDSKLMMMGNNLASSMNGNLYPWTKKPRRTRSRGVPVFLGRNRFTVVDEDDSFATKQPVDLAVA